MAFIGFTNLSRLTFVSKIDLDSLKVQREYDPEESCEATGLKLTPVTYFQFI